MEALFHQLDHLIEKRELSWRRDGHALEVELGKSARHQRVNLRQKGDTYIFWSIVAGSKFVTQNIVHWRRLAYRVWRKNAEIELVTFAFDKRDRLIGAFEQPAGTLSDEELHIYVETLANECDRFEYVLTGQDLQ